MPYDKQSEQYYGVEAQQLLADIESFVADHEDEVEAKRLEKIKKLKKLCRFCFVHDSDTAKTVAITKLESFSMDVAEMLHTIGVNSNAEDLFSDIVCEKCFTYLIEVENYRKRCRKAQQEIVVELEELDMKLHEVRQQKLTMQPVKSEVWFKVKVEEEFEAFEETFDDDQMDFEAECEVKTEMKHEPVESSTWNDNEEDFPPPEPVEKVKKVERQKKYTASYALRTFECFWCKEMIKGYSKYQNHLKNCKKEVTCEVVGCRKVFSNQGSFNYHIMRRHNMEKVTRYFCAVCNINHQMTKHKFDEHCRLCLEENKFKVQNIECGICKETFHSLQAFTAHKIFHNDNLPEMCQVKRGPEKSKAMPKVFMCDICGKIYKDNTKLRRHKVDVHFVDFTGDLYHCDLCPAKKKTRLLIYKHMNTTHIINEHACPTCGKVFRNRELWSKHQVRNFLNFVIFS